ncbi:uncharacterized protein LOC144152463, partial [Haemaphysalis longicornis]
KDQEDQADQVAHLALAARGDQVGHSVRVPREDLVALVDQVAQVDLRGHRALRDHSPSVQADLADQVDPVDHSALVAQEDQADQEHLEDLGDH